MKKMIVTSAKWVTDTTGKYSGNVTGYNSKGESVHIYGRQMEAMGLKQGDTIPKLFVLAAEKEIAPRNADGSLQTGDTITKTMRNTALSVFKSAADLATAFVEEATLDITINSEIKKAFVSNGLSDAEAVALLKDLDYEGGLGPLSFTYIYNKI